MSNDLVDVGEQCIECDVSVARGSGNYVNRIPASNDTKGGYLCSGCQCNGLRSATDQ
jgi:hypothetical protein